MRYRRPVVNWDWGRDLTHTAAVRGSAGSPRILISVRHPVRFDSPTPAPPCLVAFKDKHQSAVGRLAGVYSRLRGPQPFSQPSLCITCGGVLHLPPPSGTSSCAERCRHFLRLWGLPALSGAMFPEKKGFKSIFQKKVEPKELVRKWQASLRAEARKVERQIRGEAKLGVALPFHRSDILRLLHLIPGHLCQEIKGALARSLEGTHSVWSVAVLQGTPCERSFPDCLFEAKGYLQPQQTSRPQWHCRVLPASFCNTVAEVAVEGKCIASLDVPKATFRNNANLYADCHLGCTQ